MKILKGMNKIPGGVMVVPLLLGAVMNTFAPNATKIGGMTTALFSSAGTGTLIGLALFIVGTQLKLNQAAAAIKRGSVLLVAKFLAGFIIGILVGRYFGPAGFLGVSALAIFSAVTNSNGGLFMALQQEYGDNIDFTSQTMLSFNDGPFLTLLALGASGFANIPFKSLVASIMPLVIGMILGNLDSDMEKYFAPLNGKITMFFAFTLGQGINLKDIPGAGLSGIVLTVLVVFGSGLFLVVADKLINRRPGYAGAAASSAAGNAVATPALAAQVDPTLAALVPAATAQISAAVVLSAILTPLLTAWAAKKWGCPKSEEEKEAKAATDSKAPTKTKPVHA